MSEEILINVTPQETRVAVVEDGVLREIYIERSRKSGLVGNIFKGKVSRVLPGMQAAFIDIGLERTGFLHISDITTASDTSATTDDDSIQQPAVESLLCEGQEIMVQVVRDPLGTKGARLTTKLSISLRYLVFIPEQRHVGISQRIEDGAERERLREIVSSYKSRNPDIVAGNNSITTSPNTGKDQTWSGKGGFIVRTAAEGISEKDIFHDIDFSHKLWDSVLARAGETYPPGVVHEDLPLVMRTMRDLINADIQGICIDSKETFEKVMKFSEQFIPEFLSRIEYYTGEHPILDLYSIEDEIQKALEKKVQLKSGGYLIIDQTEAMTTIDVNTGAFVGRGNLEETIYKTNLEAVQMITRQLRLRNLGGIIIIDFIDMQDAEYSRQIMRTLDKNLGRDNTRTAMSELTSLGLVQITRKRTRESLEHTLCEPCPTCKGRSFIKTSETVCYEIFREIMREVRQFEANKLLVVASQEIVDMLLDEESSSVTELEEFIGRPISLQVESLYIQDQYDIVLL